jgi:hypothetical protein
MNVPKLALFAALSALVAGLLSGCASVTTARGVKEVGEGLVYFMPKRDIVVTLTNTGGKLASITAAPSLPYADRSLAYLLNYHRHLLAKNTLEIEISEAGLLTSSKANLTGDAVAALGGLGSVAGYVRGLNISTQSDSVEGARTIAITGGCGLDGTHTFIVPAMAKSTRICDNKIQIDVQPLGIPEKKPGTPELPVDIKSNYSDQTSYSGVFYRMNRPYKVVMRSDAYSFNAETLVHSPSESEEFFLPVARTTFSTNDAQITLNNGAGVPSKYTQNTDGELAALLKLPAAIITPYFAAIGSVFSSFSTNSTSQATLLNNQTALELAKLKHQSCIKAIEAQDTALITSLKCGGN